ncbi:MULTISPECIES: PQQ-binding-like beta-propeller repeat protein [unclassified Streptomyces]|uniref:outer membrane protein assembly factor BamB family protein n=1 Tax=unclassified Streptomyces TaxID=2593676 RepID=UPI001BEA9AD4|nr:MULTISPECIES: PQQ-binding-like beta-propeller repeat protein [unclassified Streptomyces]MBT2408451.1 PQQ-binding-like beta-propeller repeat protein [Streptomyces sp. ISL-21]MBT2457983.1 PQQ-binding-like beta-propeller repeat protein [Streptomyces sp. ISL-86]MBT2611905.1 PQQ-binding-like beta-propeller repeat protein [Streptomyces sp. ISL-87]
MVYIKGQDIREGTVYALDAATGAAKWSRPLKGGGYGQAGAKEGDSLDVPPPAVIDGAVYVSGLDEKLCVLDAATGETKWEFLSPSSVFRAPPVRTRARRWPTGGVCLRVLGRRFS